eukprot:gb/GECG01006561.1/.p1 GENE.gb/GECG01006561.1/~~gb/GECG01006561.1/.p1  ORF type:complete len:547 (+),score=69.14 gb/GECG01006561.1/:1-1641(+)
MGGNASKHGGAPVGGATNVAPPRSHSQHQRQRSRTEIEPYDGNRHASFAREGSQTGSHSSQQITDPGAPFSQPGSHHNTRSRTTAAASGSGGSNRPEFAQNYFVQGEAGKAHSTAAPVATQKSSIEQDQPQQNVSADTDEYSKMYAIQDELPPPARTRARNGFVPTVFRWEYGGNEVFIAGSFNDWKHKAMHRSGNDFTYIQELRKRKHAFKFIVDGEWQCHPDRPTEPDERGIVNNYIDLSEFTPHSASDLSMTTVDSDPEIPYTSEVPGDDIYTKDPPTLPSQLRHIILNSEVRDTKSDHKELPQPSHVTVDHLYCAAIKDGVMVQGTTRRYRRKAVTVVYYSIMPASSLTQPSPVSAYITRIPQRPEQGGTSSTAGSSQLGSQAQANQESGDSQLNRLVEAMTKEEKDLLQQRHAQIEAQLQQEQAKLQQQLQAGLITHEEATQYLSKKHSQAQQTLTQIQQSVLAHVQNRLESQGETVEGSIATSRAKRPPPAYSGMSHATSDPSYAATTEDSSSSEKTKKAQDYAAVTAAKFVEAQRKYGK